MEEESWESWKRECGSGERKQSEKDGRGGNRVRRVVVVVEGARVGDWLW